MALVRTGRRSLQVKAELHSEREVHIVALCEAGVPQDDEDLLCALGTLRMSNSVGMRLIVEALRIAKTRLVRYDPNTFSKDARLAMLDALGAADAYLRQPKVIASTQGLLGVIALIVSVLSGYLDKLPFWLAAVASMFAILVSMSGLMRASMLTKAEGDADFLLQRCGGILDAKALPP
jgi:hypothetical protein